MSVESTLDRVSQELPSFPWADWLLRLPLAFILLQQGFMKVPLSADAAAAYGLPTFLWAMAAFGEIAAGAGLILGGLLRSGLGDLITRLAGLAIAGVVAGVIVVAYWAPPLQILLYNQLQVLLLVGGAYFLLRGNRA